MIEKIEKIIKMFETASISKLELEVDNIKLKLEKKSETEDSKKSYLIKNDTDVEVTTLEPDNNKYVKSPVVGTFYTQRSENSPKFIQVGSRVKKGDVLCIVEAMKVMNEVVASEDGIVLDILAKNDELVQYNQKLIVLGE